MPGVGYNDMNACKIDDSGAGKYAQQFSVGAHRFCERHSDENWSISGTEVAGGVALNVSFDGTPIGSGWPRVLSPTLSFDDDVFRLLENLRAGL